MKLKLFQGWSQMKVELLTYTPDADKLVAAAAKLCYAKSDIDTLMDKLTPDKVESFLKMLGDLGPTVPTRTPATPPPVRALPAPGWHRSPVTASPLSRYRVSDT